MPEKGKSMKSIKDQKKANVAGEKQNKTKTQKMASEVLDKAELHRRLMDWEVFLDLKSSGKTFMILKWD